MHGFRMMTSRQSRSPIACQKREFPNYARLHRGRMWDEISYPFANFNEVWEWIRYSIPHLIMDVMYYHIILHNSQWHDIVIPSLNARIMCDDQIPGWSHLPLKISLYFFGAGHNDWQPILSFALMISTSYCQAYRHYHQSWLSYFITDGVKGRLRLCQDSAESFIWRIIFHQGIFGCLCGKMSCDKLMLLMLRH